MSTKQKSSRGCFFYGCLTLVIIMSLMILAIYGLKVGATYAMNGLVDNFTETTPRALPTVTLDEPALVNIRERFARFQQAIEERSQDATRLELTADELNALILDAPEFEDLAGKVYFQFETNRLRGEISIPLDELDLGRDETLYLNGSAVFDAAIKETGPWISIESIEINGNPLPDVIRQALLNKNILADAKIDPETKRLIESLKTFEIREDTLVLELGNGPTAEVSESADFELE